MKQIWIASLLVLASVGTASGADEPTTLVDAVKNGNRDMVRALLKQRQNVSAPEADGMTALHWAVRANDAETAQLLIRAGANVKVANRYGITPLSLAATNANAAMVEALLKAGADPNVALPDGETTLMTAARTGNAAAVKALLIHGAKVDVTERQLGQTALMWAVAEDHAAAASVLIESGANVNARSAILNFPPFKWGVNGMVSTNLPKGGWSPLMYAARQNAMASARVLIDAGADVNAPDPEGQTPLLIAIANAHYDVGAMLLERGADPNKADQAGVGPLYAAVDMNTMAPLVSRPSPKPSGKLDPTALITILLDKGANPNVGLLRPAFGKHHDLRGDATMGEGTTPFMRAARTGDVQVMRLLLARGADPYARRRDLSTALHLAAQGRRSAPPTGPKTIPGASDLEAMKLCIEAGLDVNAFNASGQTALHAAAARGADEAVKMLVALGARVDARDKQKRSPLDLVLLDIGSHRSGDEDYPIPFTTAALLREVMAKQGIPDETFGKNPSEATSR
jgi:ankyrin repeat protein